MEAKKGHRWAKLEKIETDCIRVYLKQKINSSWTFSVVSHIRKWMESKLFIEAVVIQCNVIHNLSCCIIARLV